MTVNLGGLWFRQEVAIGTKNLDVLRHSRIRCAGSHSESRSRHLGRLLVPRCSHVRVAHRNVSTFIQSSKINVLKCIVIYRMQAAIHWIWSNEDVQHHTEGNRRHWLSSMDIAKRCCPDQKTVQVCFVVLRASLVLHLLTTWSRILGIILPSVLVTRNTA